MGGKSAKAKQTNNLPYGYWGGLFGGQGGYGGYGCNALSPYSGYGGCGFGGYGSYGCGSGISPLAFPFNGAFGFPGIGGLGTPFGGSKGTVNLKDTISGATLKLKW